MPRGRGLRQSVACQSGAQLASSADGDRALAVETLELELGPRTGCGCSNWSIRTWTMTGPALLAAAASSGDRAAGPWSNESPDDPHPYWQDHWLRACALYAASELAPESAAAAALTCQDAADPALSETARWLRGELACLIAASSRVAGRRASAASGWLGKRGLSAAIRKRWPAAQRTTNVQPGRPCSGGKSVR